MVNGLDREKESPSVASPQFACRGWVGEMGISSLLQFDFVATMSLDSYLVIQDYRLISI
jgi:hypothetical protein